MRRSGSISAPEACRRPAARFLLAAAACVLLHAAGPLNAQSLWPMGGHDPQRTGQSDQAGILSDPQTVWKVHLAGRASSSPVLGLDGEIYVRNEISGLTAYSPAGAALWTYSGGYNPCAPAVGSDGTIYVPAGGTYPLRAVSPAGSQLWWLAMPGPVSSDPLFGMDGLIYTTSQGENLRAITPSGSVLWQRNFGTGSYAWRPAQLGNGDLVIRTTGPAGTKVWRLDPNGDTIWDSTISMTSSYSDPVIGTTGLIYVGTSAARVRVLDPVSGDPVRETTLLGSGHPDLALAGDGSIYATTDTSLEKIAPDGTLLWSVTSGLGEPGLPVLDAAGNVYVSENTAGPGIRAYDPDGNMLWRWLPNESTVRCLSPILGPDGVIYAATTGNYNEYGYLYAITQGPGYHVPVWAVDAGGDWSNAANWNSSPQLPQPWHDVVIDRPAGSYTVTHASGDHEINSLVSNEAFTLSGGVLRVADSIQVNNTFTLDGGTVSSVQDKTCTIRRGIGGEGITFAANPNNHLDRVWLETDLDLTAPGAVARIHQRLKLNGQARLGPGSVLSLEGGESNNQTYIDGSADIFFDGGGHLSVERGSTVFVQSSVRIHGGGGTLGGAEYEAGSSSIILRGQLYADVPGTPLTLAGPGFSCHEGGLISVSTAGATLRVEAGWFGCSDGASIVVANGGTLEVLNSYTHSYYNNPTLTIGAGSSMSVAGEFHQTGGTITLDGTLTASHHEGLQMEDGRLSGSGTLIGKLANQSDNGIVIPRGAAGGLTVDGDYLQTASGVASWYVSSTIAGDGYNPLTVTGHAALDGHASLTPQAGYTYTLGDRFTLIQAGSLSGRFSGVGGMSVPSTMSLVPTYSFTEFGVLVTRRLSTQWIGTTGSWHDDGNWSDGQPLATEDAGIDNGGTALIVTNTAAIQNLYLGIFNEGHVQHSNGAASIADLYIGDQAGATGSYTLSSTASLTSMYDYVGNEGHGEVTQRDATRFAATRLNLGYAVGGSGEYRMEGGTLNTTDMIFVGSQGDGTFLQSGGNVENTFSSSRPIYLGYEVGAAGRYEMSAGTVNGHYFVVGELGTGELILSGGTVNGGLSVGYNERHDAYHDDRGAGTFTMTGGTVNGGLQVGYLGIGAVHHSGGSIVGAYLTMGQGSRAEGTYDYSGTAALSLKGVTMARYGKATFAMSDDRVLNLTEDIEIGGEVTGDGTFEMYSGTVSAVTLDLGYKGKAVFRQHAGSASFERIYLAGNTTSDAAYELLGGTLTTDAITQSQIGTSVFTQADGTTNTTNRLSVDDSGRYEMYGGTLEMNEGGFVDGVFDMNNAAGTIHLAGGFFDVSGHNPISVGNATFRGEATTLFIHSYGGNGPADYFRTFSSDGIVHRAGTTLTIPAGKSALGYGEIFDHVYCTGLLAESHQYKGIVLHAGLEVHGSGTVRIPYGYIRIRNTISGMTGGLLETTDLQIGDGNQGLFYQRGGTVDYGTGLATTSAVFAGYGKNSVGTYRHEAGSMTTGQLYVGYWYGSTGRYELGGTGSLHVKLDTWVAYNYDGAANRGLATGTFVQSGGTAQLDGSLYLGRSYESGYVGYTGVYELSAGSLYVGNEEQVGAVNGGGAGRFTQTGGSHVVGYMLQVAGRPALFELSAGSLQVGLPEYDDGIETIYSTNATFTQTGGTHVVYGDWKLGGTGSTGTGTFNFSGGSLRVSGEMRINAAMHVTQPGLSVVVGRKLTFGKDGQLSIPEPSTWLLNGTDVTVESTREANFADLMKLTLVIDAPTTAVDTFEVAGMDLGADTDGFDENFALAGLRLEGITHLKLVDDVDNGNRFGTAGFWEATYVETLAIADAAMLDLNGLKLYVGQWDRSAGYNGTVLQNGGQLIPAISGDSNYDGQVNIFDAFCLNAAWGTSLGDPRFDPNADFNGDGQINIFDAFLLNQNWGQTVGSLRVTGSADGSDSVPEPATAGLLLLGAWGLRLRGRSARGGPAARPRARRHASTHSKGDIA